MSVGLVLVRAHRPDGLERSRLWVPSRSLSRCSPFEAEIDELALPPGDGRGDPPFGVVEPAGRLDAVVAGAEHPAPAEPGVEVQEGAVAVGRRPELGGVEPVAFGPEGDLPAGAGLRRPIGEPEVEPDQPAPEVGVVVVAAGAGEAELGVGGAAELPEVLQPKQQRGLRGRRRTAARSRRWCPAARPRGCRRRARTAARCRARGRPRSALPPRGSAGRPADTRFRAARAGASG